jgi:Uma2 family endonuclease
VIKIRVMSVATKVAQPATRADLEALPEDVVGEIIEGVLYTFPRPRAVHAHVEGYVVGDLQFRFERGRGGPGGWWILVEPGIELPGSPEVVPDVAGWRKERMPELPEDRAINVVPDWVCEILSLTTRAHDLRVKRPFYARVGVRHLWFVDVEARTLVVSKLVQGHWLELGVYGEADAVRAEPFDAVEIALGEWWPKAAKKQPRRRRSKPRPRTRSPRKA